MEDGPTVGVPVLLVETDTPAGESVRAVRIRQSCNDLPSSEGTIADSWEVVQALSDDLAG